MLSHLETLKLFAVVLKPESENDRSSQCRHSSFFFFSTLPFFNCHGQIRGKYISAGCRARYYYEDDNNDKKTTKEREAAAQQFIVH